jgi:hypothetical protein
MDAKRALILETQEKDAEGNNVYSVTRPEVVLPTYMLVHLVWIKEFL